MNFPMEYPVYQFFYWFLNTPGIGGIFVGILTGVLMLTFGNALRWVSNGGDAKESEIYTYPTSALHDHEHHPGK